jgi:class 3 adenylate cyclase
MAGLDREETAAQAGVDAGFIDRLIELNVLKPGADGTFTTGDVRRARLIFGLDSAGLALEHVAESVRRGDFRLEMFDLQSFETRFSPLSHKTFAMLAEESRVPLELLMVVREAIGLAQPGPDDPVRENELEIVPAIKHQLDRGFNPATIERWLRVYGDSLRRMADTEGAWWDSEIMAPIFAGGVDIPQKIDEASRWGLGMSQLIEAAILAMYHAHQEHVWSQNIFDGVEEQLELAGLRNKFARPPAMCFLDMTGYTRLTEERGDEAAADLAASMARMVQRTSREHGGKLVKWLGDGVMFFYRDPGPGVVAALKMVDGIISSGLPPAHVGIHAGPVVFQEGDYFGRTVNIAARIAAYARPGEVLVSQEVIDASEVEGVSFTSIGAADLKGVSGELVLHSAKLQG